jgi:hypothetical protein
MNIRNWIADTYQGTSKAEKTSLPNTQVCTVYFNNRIKIDAVSWVLAIVQG